MKSPWNHHKSPSINPSWKSPWKSPWNHHENPHPSIPHENHHEITMKIPIHQSLMKITMKSPWKSPSINPSWKSPWNHHENPHPSIPHENHHNFTHPRIAKAWHCPKPDDFEEYGCYAGAGTVGSTEAIFIGGVVLSPWKVVDLMAWKMVKNGEKWRKIVKNGEKMWKMVKHGEKWWNMVKNGGL